MFHVLYVGVVLVTRIGAGARRPGLSYHDAGKNRNPGKTNPEPSHTQPYPYTRRPYNTRTMYNMMHTKPVVVCSRPSADAAEILHPR